MKKIENQLNRIISQERKLVDLHLEDSIDEEVCAKKYKKLTKQKEELLDEKKTLELTIKDENSIKERLKPMTLINCTPTRMTRIKNYVPKQKTTHVEALALLVKKRSYTEK